MKAKDVYNSKQYIELKEKIIALESTNCRLCSNIRSHEHSVRVSDEMVRKANKERNEALDVIIKIVNKSY